MKLYSEDTICALATPAGRGGIGVIRVSGPRAFAIVDAVSRRLDGKPCAKYRGHTLHNAVIVDQSGEAIDEVLLAVFRGPRSYTGEDTIEISAHGGPVPIRRILAQVYAAGARPAGPGEFTQRAYLNGRLDLAQAEAVADIIEAETEEAHRLALRQQSGLLSAAVTAARDIVLGALARIEASIDFPEDVGELDTDACAAELREAASRLDALLATADAGIIYREGIKIVLAGRPNVGKSSLMNALLRADRAIVTPVPGTTRDVIEESANLRGIRVRFLDTAGLRQTSDLVEQMGVERSRTTVLGADLVLLVCDASTGWTAEDETVRGSLSDIPHMVVWNKWDIAEPTASPSLKGREYICVSAKTGWNLASLEAAIVQRAMDGCVQAVENESAVVTHSRHRHALRTAREALAAALQTIDNRMPPDFISIDVLGALTALGEITGETASEDIINEIFSRFCIGK